MIQSITVYSRSKIKKMAYRIQKSKSIPENAHFAAICIHPNSMVYNTVSKTLTKIKNSQKENIPCQNEIPNIPARRKNTANRQIQRLCTPKDILMTNQQLKNLVKNYCSSRDISRQRQATLNYLANTGQQTLLLQILANQDTCPDFVNDILLNKTKDFTELLLANKEHLPENYQKAKNLHRNPKHYLSDDLPADIIDHIVTLLATRPDITDQHVNFLLTKNWTSKTAIDVMIWLNQNLDILVWDTVLRFDDPDLLFLDVKQTMETALQQKKIQNMEEDAEEILQQCRICINNWNGFTKALDILYQDLYGPNPKRIWKQWQIQQRDFNYNDIQLTLYLLAEQVCKNSTRKGEKL